MKNAPFFVNTPDDAHCVQASFRIMLKYFLPELDFGYQQLDEMSHYQPGKGAWWPPMLVELKKLGLDVKCIEGFDYKRFHEEGKAYVRSAYRPETADYYLKHCNLMETQDLVPDFLKKVDVATRPAAMDDLDGLLAGGWLAGIDLNAAVLNDLKRADYVGDMAVVFDAGKDYFRLHDPGLMPHPNRQVSRRKLADAWFWSGQKNAGLVAVKRA